MTERTPLPEAKWRMPFDPTKPVQTRDGRKARIICTDRGPGEEWSIVALVQAVRPGHETMIGYRADGLRFEDARGDLDLVNVPQKHKGWVILFKGKREAFFRREGDYKFPSIPDNGEPLACIEIEFEEGEGL